MESDASDNYEDLYEEIDAVKHDTLVDKVLSLNKTQQLKKASRTEPTLQISEFNLVKSVAGDKGSVHVNELTKSLKNKKSRIKINEGVRKASKNSHTLPKPLEKPQADRIRRGIAYEKARLHLDRWEAVVTSNRVSTSLRFPLNNDMKMEKREAQDYPKMWRIKSKLEEELEKIERKVEEHHIDLEQEKFPLTMKEMLSRRKEAAKLRAFQGYQEAKARRQNKIKSKKYHRILKKEKIKQKLQEFEQLQKTDPELAMKKLDEIEKSRVEERFSLKHKSTGKWARSKQIRAKYDKESRQALAQQLTISRELTQKLKAKQNDSDEEDNEDENIAQIQDDKSNPWVNGMKPEKEVVDFVIGYRKYWMEKNKNSNQEDEKNSMEFQDDKEDEVENINNQVHKLQSEKVTECKGNEIVGHFVQEDISVKKIVSKNGNESIQNQKENLTVEKKKIHNVKKKAASDLNESKSTTDWKVKTMDPDTSTIDTMFDGLEKKMQKRMLKKGRKLKKQLKEKKSPRKQDNKPKKKIDLSLPLQIKKPIIDEELVQDTGASFDETQKNKGLELLKTVLTSDPKKAESNIDPNSYMKVTTTNLETALPDLLTADENEENLNQRALITEAFEDDDIVQEFNKEKKNETDKNKPKDINLSLPGWGSWSGTNIAVSKRKRRRFTIKAPKKVPRRDDNKGSLIINEKAQKKIKEHMVSEVPFPFKTVKDFEASMRAPISNTFVPETAYRKLIQPPVITKMGTIIEPMTKDILLNKKK